MKGEKGETESEREQKSKKTEKRTRWRKSGENEVQSLMWKIASHEMKVWKLKQFYIYVL